VQAIDDYLATNQQIPKEQLFLHKDVDFTTHWKTQLVDNLLIYMASHGIRRGCCTL